MFLPTGSVGIPDLVRPGVIVGRLRAGTFAHRCLERMQGRLRAQQCAAMAAIGLQPRVQLGLARSGEFTEAQAGCPPRCVF